MPLLLRLLKSTRELPPALKCSGAAALLSLASGCSIYPMGLTATEWRALSPAQQAEYRARERELAAQRFRIAENDRLARERAELARVADLHTNGRYGDVITVVVEHGMVAFYGKRYPFEPVAFDIARGETKSVTFTRLGRVYEKTEIVMTLSMDGNTFTFDEPARKRYVAPNSGWQEPRRYAVHEMGARDGHSEAIGVVLTIRYKDPARGRHH